ncbi:SDR family oxidoreductase [Parasphingopyxis algicola]|uniref:SDR family oxidoreductase n=1 Tax=Parasphingopyxis algicola TaxID=2026624 RepID=UPI0015A25226|nr:SDR family oxidoreductase [Parasphingopyxis algicola]QLC25573.1 SDR family oxidoreductase [Parasphingopyxis algicola]
MAADSSGACLVIGAGDDTGGAIARAFAREGLAACLVRRPRHAGALETLASSIRSDGGVAHAMPTDARDEDAMIALVAQIESEVGPIEAAVFNIGANVNFPITETTARVYRKVWEMAAFAGFLMGREVAKNMAERGRGTILFTGATASLRGGPGYSAFAGAKFALRALAQTMARELGPKNIHVAHVVIDGAIDSKFIRENLPDVDTKRDEDAILSPDAIAANYVMLHKQPRSAWTHELDLRPWKESW